MGVICILTTLSHSNVSDSSFHSIDRKDLSKFFNKRITVFIKPDPFIQIQKIF